MITHSDFGKLRLVQFLPNAEIAQLGGWEFEDRLWVGEAVGFSEWLRPEDEPNVLRSLAIDFAQFPADVASRVIETLGIPVARGMTLPELNSRFGEPVRTYRFVPDRVTVEFSTPRPNSYQIGCTVLHDGGLTHLVVMALDT
jgi:hypothetical protein